MGRDSGDLDARSNNFGLLRLSFAALVVVSHAAAQLTDDPANEPLVRLFGTLSFGEVAVDGFFLISGYLISQSFARSTLPAFAVKRAGRILPGFVVASGLCTFVLAPRVGATEPVTTLTAIATFAKHATLLLPPVVPGTFPGLPYPALNGSMWTIAPEAACYIGVAALGLVFRRSRLTIAFLAACVAALLALTGLHTFAGDGIAATTERLGKALRLAGMFGTGALFYLLRDHITWRPAIALAVLAVLLAAMISPALAEPAVAICGGYLIFFVAFKAPRSRLGRFTDRVDVSYGLYLYAWPVAQTVIYTHPAVTQAILTLTTLLAATACGAVSWFVVEKPALRLAHRAASRLNNAYVIERGPSLSMS